MDELSMVRELLAEPAPSPEVVAEGRERLLGSAEASSLRPEGSDERPSERTGVTGAAAAATLAVAWLVSGSGTSPGGGSPVVTDVSARGVLLAAAVRAESESAKRQVLARALGVEGDPAAAVRARQQPLHAGAARRSPRTGRRTTAAPVLGRREWVRPKTPQDEAAWRRDGAPSQWCIGKTDTAPPEPICLRTAPGTAS